MSPTSPTPPDETTDEVDDVSPVDAMDQADVANGENPDAGPPESSPTPATGHVAHPTGERQASQNREDDPPA